MKRRIFEVRAWPGQGRSRVDREYPQVRGNHIVLGKCLSRRAGSDGSKSGGPGDGPDGGP